MTFGILFPESAGTMMGSKETVSPPINLVTITKQDAVPQEVSAKDSNYIVQYNYISPLANHKNVILQVASVSCDRVGLIPVVYNTEYNVKSTKDLKLPRKQRMLNNKPVYILSKL